MKQKIIVIVGPTAVGKTNISIQLAQKFNGELISGDSMQIYQHLNIGTAQATIEEQKEVKHHLIDCIPVTEPYTVSDFKKQARFLIDDIITRGKVPIIVGGTGLYIQSLLYDFSLGGTGDSNPAYRKELETLAQTENLWLKLKEVDPISAEKIHENNVQRVIRALEVYHLTGQPFSTFQKEVETPEIHYDACLIGLTTDRKKLYERIDIRVEEMITSGLVKEAKWLFAQNIPESQAAKGIGYKELFPYFKGEMSLPSCVEKIQQHTRQYAKRQLTWFRNRMAISWWNLVEHPEELPVLLTEVKDFLATPKVEV